MTPDTFICILCFPEEKPVKCNLCEEECCFTENILNEDTMFVLHYITNA